MALGLAMQLGGTGDFSGYRRYGFFRGLSSFDPGIDGLFRCAKHICNFWNPTQLALKLNNNTAAYHGGASAFNVFFVIRDSFLWARPLVNASVNTAPTYPKPRGPIEQTKFLSLKLNQIVISTISCLFSSAGPATVARRIAQIVIYALKRVLARWFWPDISKKPSKRAAPFIANSYSSAPIITVTSIFSIMTPLDHLRPRPPFWGFGHTVSTLPRAKLFPMQTPTTKSVSGRKIGASHKFLGATIALTQPHCIAKSFSRSSLFIPRHDKQALESLAAQINKSTHKISPLYLLTWTLENPMSRDLS